jgi:hypothetical protein
MSPTIPLVESQVASVKEGKTPACSLQAVSAFLDAPDSSQENLPIHSLDGLSEDSELPQCNLCLFFTAKAISSASFSGPIVTIEEEDFCLKGITVTDFPDTYIGVPKIVWKRFQSFSAQRMLINFDPEEFARLYKSMKHFASIVMDDPAMHCVRDLAQRLPP